MTISISTTQRSEFDLDMHALRVDKDDNCAFVSVNEHTGCLRLPDFRKLVAHIRSAHEVVNQRGSAVLAPLRVFRGLLGTSVSVTLGDDAVLLSVSGEGTSSATVALREDVVESLVHYKYLW